MDPRLFLLICLAAAFRPQPSSVLEVEANDPQDHAFNETDFQRLRDAVNSGDEDRMEDIADAEMWPSFVKTHPEEAWRLFKKLATDKVAYVRGGAARSPAWPDLIKLNLSQSWQLFAELMSHDALTSEADLRDDVVDLPLWKAFGKVPPTAVTEHRDSQKLQIARSLQKVADAGLSHEIRGLPLFDGLSTRVQRSTNETWLGEMVKLPLFVGQATLGVSPAENVYLDCLSEFFRK